MSLKQDKGGKWLIESGADFEAAVVAVEEREEMIAQAEKIMEEEYDYITIQTEKKELEEAIREWMVENDQAAVVRPDYKLTLVRRSSTYWNPDKLRKIVGDKMWKRITKRVVDTDAIDDLAKQGVLDKAKIAPALEQSPQKPHLRRYGLSDESAAEAEGDALKAAMGD